MSASADKKQPNKVRLMAAPLSRTTLNIGPEYSFRRGKNRRVEQHGGYSPEPAVSLAFLSSGCAPVDDAMFLMTDSRNGNRNDGSSNFAT
jgi:hypothetical protein